MTYHFNKQAKHFGLASKQGFSLIELMVVMAIMAVVMSLSGGLFQQSINQQERHVELEKVRQLFKQLTYNAYYQGKVHDVRLEENKLLVFIKPKFDLKIDENDGSEDSGLALDKYSDDALESTETSRVLMKEVVFSQLTFVAQDFRVTTKGVISPNQFSIFSGDNTRSFPLSSVFVTHE